MQGVPPYRVQMRSQLHHQSQVGEQLDATFEIRFALNKGVTLPMTVTSQCRIVCCGKTFKGLGIPALI